MNEQDSSKQKVIVTVQDLRAAKLCFQGSRPWLARHGLSWQAFLANGQNYHILQSFFQMIGSVDGLECL